MTRESSARRLFSVEDFVQNLTAQLDKAQDALAIKAKTGRPLTFALKDLTVDLKVFWEVPEGELKLRHANPNEEGASTVHLSFTTITRDMAEENSLSLSLDEDPRSLSEIAEEGTLGEAERRQLEMVGVRTVGQFKRLTQNTDPKHMEAYLGIPVNRLRMALERSARPAVISNEAVNGPDRRRLLRIHGANLMSGGKPSVKLSGEPVEVLEADNSELLVKPMSHHFEGQLEVDVAGQKAAGFYQIPREHRDAIPAGRQHAQNQPKAVPGAAHPGGAPQTNPQAMAAPSAQVSDANGAFHRPSGPGDPFAFDHGGRPYQPATQHENDPGTVRHDLNRGVQPRDRREGETGQW